MLNTLLSQCFDDENRALIHVEEKIAFWEHWLLPICQETPVGNDPQYEDVFQSLREEVNKLSGADITLVLTFCETLLTQKCKDVRVVTYYIWARLFHDGEKGLAEGLVLLAGLVVRFGEMLLPHRVATRASAIEWLNSPKVLGSLSRYPEVDKQNFRGVIAALFYLTKQFSEWQIGSQPTFDGLVAALETRLVLIGGLQVGGLEATGSEYSVSRSTDNLVTPKPTLFNQNNPRTSHSEINIVQSTRDLLEQTKSLACYLREQPQGWLASSRLMRVVRWDTVHQLPATDPHARTKLNAPRQELRQKLKRLYINQHWLELLEQVEIAFAESANHFWLDLQWYSAQSLQKLASPYDDWLMVLKRDLLSLLERLPTLELLLFQDGTTFADEVTQAWIEKLIEPNVSSLVTEQIIVTDTLDISTLEVEAINLADNKDIEAALRWVSQIPGMKNAKSRFLQRLLMARIAERYSKQEMAIHLLSELLSKQVNSPEIRCDLTEWEPELFFEVNARLLKLLRHKHQRDKDKTLYQQRTEPLMAALIRIDPVRASALCT